MKKLFSFATAFILAAAGILLFGHGHQNEPCHGG